MQTPQIKFEKSAVAENAWMDGHTIECNQVEILDTLKVLNERKVKEALYIKLIPQECRIKLVPQECRINRDERKELSPLAIAQRHQEVNTTLPKEHTEVTGHSGG